MNLKSIYEGKVLEALPIAGGVVFAYVSDTTEEGKTVVSYRHINFETGRTNSVTKKIFQLAKFGANYQKIEEQALHHLSTLSTNLDDGKTFLVERDGAVKLLDNEGESIFFSSFLYKKEAPYAIASNKNAVWASFKEGNAIVKYDIELLREELRIGGGNHENSFLAPTGLFLKDDFLWVCNEGSKKIWKVNIKNYEVSEAYTFKEPVYSYMQTAGLELVVLSSGLYLI